MPVTRGGIYHNLLESKYVTSLGDVSYFFSSKLYQKKFENQIEDNRIYFANKLNNVVSQFDNNVFSDMMLYLSVEKRGFRVKVNGGDVTWQEFLKYALGKKINN